MFTNNIRHIFEDGDKGRGLLSDAVLQRGINRPLFEPGKPQKDKPSLHWYVQLQASDYLAFELKRVGHKKREEIRRSLKYLLKDEIFHVSKYEPEDIRKICGSWKIPKR